jgi:hypothetical protein
MKATSSRSLLTLPAVVALVVFSSAPARAATYAKTFELHTLDHQYAASLVVDLCKSLEQRPADCKVQLMGPGSISVWGTPAVHAAIIKMLAQRDVPVGALGFRVILVQSGGEASASRPESPEVRKALAAVRELLGLSSTFIEDTGLISTNERGSTRLVAADGTAYDVGLRIRSVIIRATGREATVEIELSESSAQPNKPVLLASVVTLKIGETIVAGASRARSGKQPLIVLLTALYPGERK